MSTATLLAKTPARNGTGKYQCPKCDHPPFSTPQGMHMHDGRVHTGIIKAFREKGRTKRKYTRRIDLYKGLDASVTVRRGPGRPRKYNREALVEAVLDRHATPVEIKCPVCTYDFGLLMHSKIPNMCCPGCGTRLQTLVEKLSAVMKP